MKRNVTKLIETIIVVTLIVALMVACVISDTAYLLIPMIGTIILFGVLSFVGVLLISIAITYFFKMNWM